MNQLTEFLQKLGGLHDAHLVAVNWQAGSQAVEFVVGDLYANFGGLPEYPGRHQGVIRFDGVTRIEFDIEASEKLRIFEMLPADEQANEVLVKFSPSGRVRIRYTSASHPQILI